MSTDGATLLEQTDPFVLADGKVNSGFPLGTIVPESEEGGPSVRVIFVGLHTWGSLAQESCSQVNPYKVFSEAVKGFCCSLR